MARLGSSIRLTVIDPFEASLERAQARWKEVTEEGAVPSTVWSTHLDVLESDVVRVAVVATSADVRLAVTTELLNLTSQVEHLVLEKVLVQSVDDLKHLQARVQSAGSTAWVNCPRRMWAGYQRLARRLRNCGPLHVTVEGGDWGLGCNSIHFVDLFALLTEAKEFKVDATGLDSEVQPSRRKGFVEFTGTLELTAESGSSLRLISHRHDKRPIIVDVRDDAGAVHLRIDESGDRIVDLLDSQAEDALGLRYQSQLSDLFTASLLKDGHCQLTPLALSAQLHHVLLHTLHAHLMDLPQDIHVSASDGHVPIT